MKLPRCAAFTSNVPSRGREPLGTGAAPSSGVPATPNRDRDGAASSGSTVRRCQSVNSAHSAPHRRPHRGGGLRESRSHSGGPRRTTAAQPRPPSSELPIPARHGGPQRDHRGPLAGLDNAADQQDNKDLAKMYDYATWNMYERIVNARRQRLSQAAPRGTTSPAKAKAGPKPRARTAAGPRSEAGHESESLAGQTADETDRASTASSSWSRTDSPGTFPPAGGGSFLPVFDPPLAPCCGLRSRRPEESEPLGGEGEEDSFIFELDM